jgi:hypothetical protein
MPDKGNKNDWMKVVKKVFSLCNCYQHFRPLNMCATQFYEKKSTTHLGRTGSQTTFVEYLPKNDLPELLPTAKYYKHLCPFLHRVVINNGPRFSTQRSLPNMSTHLFFLQVHTKTSVCHHMILGNIQAQFSRTSFPVNINSLWT